MFGQDHDFHRTVGINTDYIETLDFDLDMEDRQFLWEVSSIIDPAEDLLIIQTLLAETVPLRSFCDTDVVMLSSLALASQAGSHHKFLYSIIYNWNQSIQLYAS